MGFKDRLDALRAQFEQCTFIAFTDVSTQTVLATSAAEKIPQERWDSLCEIAADMLLSGAEHSIRAALDEVPVERVILMDTRECNVFLSSAQAPEYALCCVCHPDIAMATFLSAATTLYNDVVADG